MEQKNAQSVRKNAIFCLLALAFEVAVCALLAASIASFSGRAKPIGVPLSDWRSDYIAYHGGWHIDESYGGSGSVDMIYGPYITLPRGTYNVKIDYECDNDQSCIVSSTTDYAYVRSGRSTLPKGSRSVSYGFTLTEETGNLELVVRYGGTGFLTIKGIEITPSATGQHRALAVLAALFVAADLCYALRRRIAANGSLILLLCGIAALPSLPLSMDGIAFGHDLVFHLNRIEGIADELSRGVFPVRMSSLWMGGRGYPVSIYYGDLLLYFPAILRLIGFPIHTAYKCYILAINLATTLISYGCFKAMFSSKSIALVTTLAYVTAGYRFSCLYVRSAVGEYTAMAFLPLIALAIFRIYAGSGRGAAHEGGASGAGDAALSSDAPREKSAGDAVSSAELASDAPREKDACSTFFIKNATILAIGMAGVVTSHVLSTEMVAVVLLAFAIVLFKKTFRKETLLTLLLAAGETLLFSLYFIVPFLDYYLNVDAAINHTVEETLKAMQGSGAYIGQYFSFFQDAFGYGNVTTPLPERMALSPGITLMAALLMGFAIMAKGKSSRAIRVLTLFSAGLLFVASNLFPWNRLEATSKLGAMLSQVQFPWRYIGPACIFLAVLLGFILLSLESGGRTAQGKILSIASAASCVLAATFSVSGYADQASIQHYYDTPELNTSYVADGEYMRAGSSYGSGSGSPSWQDMEEVAVLERDGCHMLLHCKSGGSEGMVQAPITNYKGYRVTDDAGNEYPIFDGDDCQIAFYLPAGFDGDVSIDFAEPWYWRASEAASLVSILALAIVPLARMLIKRKT